MTMNKFNSYFSLSGGANLLYSIPRKFNRFKLGFSAGYNKYKGEIKKAGTNYDYFSINANDTAKYTEDITTSNSFILVNLCGMYIINPLNKMKFFAKAGLSYNFSTTRNNSLYTNYTYTRTGVRNGIPYTPESGRQQEVFLQSVGANFADFVGGTGIIYGRHKLEIAYMPAANLSDSGNTPFKLGSMAVYYYLSLFK
jgi:hypothetical protein